MENFQMEAGPKRVLITNNVNDMNLYTPKSNKPNKKSDDLPSLPPTRDTSFIKLFNSPSPNKCPTKLSGMEIDDNLADVINHANEILCSLGMKKLGNFMSFKEEEIYQTLDVVLDLINQRTSDLDFRRTAVEIRTKLEREKSTLFDNLQQVKSENNTLSNKILSLQNSTRILEKKCFEEKERLLAEKEEINKNITKLNQKCVQYQHEIRKKGTENNKLKDQMLKLKSSIGLKPQAKFISSQGSESFTVKNTLENKHRPTNNIQFDNQNKNLLQENNQLRNMLRIIQDELVKIITHTQLKAKNISKENTNNFLSDIKKHEISNAHFDMPIMISERLILDSMHGNLKNIRMMIDNLLQEKIEIKPEAVTVPPPQSTNQSFKVYHSNLTNIQLPSEKPLTLQEKRATWKKRTKSSITGFQGSLIGDKTITHNISIPELLGQASLNKPPTSQNSIESKDISPIKPLISERFSGQSPSTDDSVIFNFSEDHLKKHSSQPHAPGHRRHPSLNKWFSNI